MDENGREFYKQNQECDFEKAGDWVARNVFPHLDEFDMGARSPLGADAGRGYTDETGGWWRESQVWRMRREIRKDLLAFIGGDPQHPEFWGYYSSYDWVALCQLFGPMVNLPKGWPMWCHDLKQWAESLGDPLLPKPGRMEHHALADATWNKDVWEYLYRMKGDD